MQSCPLPKDEKTICYGKSPSVQRALTRTTAEIWPVSFTMREQPLTLRWTTLVSLVAKKGHAFTMSRFTGLCWVCIHGASTFSPIILVSSLVGTVALTKLGGRWCYKHFGTASGTSNQTTACFRRQNHWHDAFLLWPTGMKVSHTVGCHLWYKAGSQLFRF